MQVELSKRAGPGRKSPKNEGLGHKKFDPFKTGPF